MFVNLNDIERIKDAIENIHGSGINYDYDFEVGYSSRYGMVLKATNAYDVMNETGMYTGVVNFSVRIPVKHPDRFVILFHSGYHDRDNLREYLDDLYASAIERVLVK